MKNLFLLLFIFGSLSAFGQQTTVDSIKYTVIERGSSGKFTITETKFLSDSSTVVLTYKEKDSTMSDEILQNLIDITEEEEVRYQNALDRLNKEFALIKDRLKELRKVKPND